MSEPSTANAPYDRLAPLFEPWERPDKHRGRAPSPDQPAPIINRRRPSDFTLVNLLRDQLANWRDQDYCGVSDTSRQLLHHWFRDDHTGGDGTPFRYYFCQREAIETLIFLYEQMQLTCLTNLLGEYGDTDEDRRLELALGVSPDDDRWPKYAFKIATGAGKTKIMSLAIVWSYFHALRESDSTLAQNFVVIAPGLTVFERLKLDFADGRIFQTDPLIPPAWRGDWHLTTVLQDEASGAAAGATLYLTNIHRLYDPDKRRRKAEEEYFDWAGPPVSRATALDVGEELRARITSHPRLMVLNDEAHHVWDPGSSWNKAIDFLHTAGGAGRLCAQLDFSATPKDQKGRLFQHIVVESALGEAVDAGIVKTPVIGRGSGLRVDETADDASDRFLQHLIVGYQRWRQSYDEWQPSGKTPLMFVMCEDTAAADQIARRLDSDERFELLNNRTINLHTNLRGKIVKRGRAPNHYLEFVESESSITAEDLATLRRLSRELDADTSPYRCIVSVLMLREGWDVRNVTTIVPLRPLSADARILPEQTLGRGLRRMTPPVGGANEVVVVVEHEAFVDIVRDTLAGEGVDALIQDVADIERQTVTIFPDHANKPVAELDIALPQLSPELQTVTDFQPPSFEQVRSRFEQLHLLPLALGEPQSDTIEYTERTLFSNERLVELEMHVPLLRSALTAPSYFVRELETALSLRGLLGPEVANLIKRFLCEVAFGQTLQPADPRLSGRLGEADVKDCVRAVFAPLLRQVSTKQVARQQLEPRELSSWQPFQVTRSANKPVTPASKTLFNLVTCDRSLERRFAEFLDTATDAAAFAKNAGPQALNIDYLASGQRLAFYRPDFFIRLHDGQHLLLETKGQVDADVPLKARAADAWCRSATTKNGPAWTYVYLTQARFESFSGNSLLALVEAAGPDLRALLDQAATTQLSLPLFEATSEGRTELLHELIDQSGFDRLPPRWRDVVEEAVALFEFTTARSASIAPAFQPLLPRFDAGLRALITNKLRPHLPSRRPDQDRFFEPIELDEVFDVRLHRELEKHARNLRKGLLFGTPLLMPLGLTGFCFDHARSQQPPLPGVFAAIRQEFAPLLETQLPDQLRAVNDFRNSQIAHADQPLLDQQKARTELKVWLDALVGLVHALS